MITITDPGVNHCTCMMCSTQFFFDKEDILKGERFPYVICPKCGHKWEYGYWQWIWKAQFHWLVFLDPEIA